MDDYDDSFWDFDFDGDGDIDATDDLWGDLLFLAHMEEVDREPRSPRPSGSSSPGTEAGGAILIMTLLLLVLALIFCGLL